MNFRFNKRLLLIAAAFNSAKVINAFDDPKVHMADDLVAIQNEFIVVLKTPAEGGRRSRHLAEQAAGTISATVPGAKVKEVFHATIEAFTVGMTADEAHEMAKSDEVDYIEQNSIVKADAVTWGLDRVDQRDLPLDDSYTVGSDGSGVHAYIIDTGIRTSHNEFSGRATWGINTSGDGDDRDCNGHGTHVAGTVGGSVYGVAKNVNLVAVKVLTCGGSGSNAGVIAGVEWVQNDAIGKKATANMSLGGGFSSALNTAVKNLHNSGVPTVVAAGNENTDACSKSPASEPDVITVGSTTSTDARSSFSNFGTCVDVFAPGSSITAAWINNDDDLNTISGTSMASPHVCGGAALLLSAGINTNQITSELSSRATEGAVSNPGNGSPNKLLYVGPIGPTAAPTPAPPTPAPTPCTGKSLEVTVTTDNYPLETSWTIKNTCTEEEVKSVTAGYYTAPGNTETISECVSITGEYEFTISDSYGDGICCAYGNGSYEIKLDGDVVAEGNSFGSSETKTFGSCSSTNPPISSPTAPPTAPPTSSPTSSPTATPTSSPTSKAPTTAPDDCNEDADAEFLWESKNRTKTCGWLGGVGNRRQKNVCREDGTNGNNNAQDVCTVTCEKWMLFTHQNRDRSCRWLSKHDNKDSICASNPEASEICFFTCGACNN